MKSFTTLETIVNAETAKDVPTLLVGTSAAHLVEALFNFPVAFSLPVMWVALVVSMVVGIGFGIYPAWLAARMNPVEALRS